MIDSYCHDTYSIIRIFHGGWSIMINDRRDQLINVRFKGSRLLAGRKVADCNRHANLLNKSEHFFLVFLHPSDWRIYPSDWRIYSAFIWLMGHFCRIFFRLEELTKMSAKVLNVCYSIRASFKPRDVFTMVKCWDPTNPQISAVFFISPPKRKYTALQQHATTCNNHSLSEQQLELNRTHFPLPYGPTSLHGQKLRRQMFLHFLMAIPKLVYIH